MSRHIHLGAEGVIKFYNASESSENQDIILDGQGYSLVFDSSPRGWSYQIFLVIEPGVRVILCNMHIINFDWSHICIEGYGSREDRLVFGYGVECY